jgi:hypothetical protein
MGGESLADAILFHSKHLEIADVTGARRVADAPTRCVGLRRVATPWTTLQRRAPRCNAARVATQRQRAQLTPRSANVNDQPNPNIHPH